jgi:EpsI family protein
VTKIAVAFGFLALNFYVYHFFASEEVLPVRQHFESFSLELGDWSCQGLERMDPVVERTLGVTDYLICEFSRGGEPINVYVGYHESQVRRQGGGGRETVIHPPKHCLPGSGWDIVEHDLVPISFPGLPERPAGVNRLVIAKGEDRRLVYYWYQSRGRVIAEDWKKVVFMSWDRARLQRTDGSLVRFTLPMVRGQEERAEAQFRDLAPQVLAGLPAYVPN